MMGSGGTELSCCVGVQHEGDVQATVRRIRELDLDIQAFTVGCESVRSGRQAEEHGPVGRAGQGGDDACLAAAELSAHRFVSRVGWQGVEFFDAVSSAFGGPIKSNGCELSSAR